MAEKEQIADLVRMAHEAFYADYEPGQMYSEFTADYLMKNGVALQTAPISYKRLLELAETMHRWIFLHCADEREVYDELGITEKENYIFGYGGGFEVLLTESSEGDEE
jgi:hypothetical protein